MRSLSEAPIWGPSPIRARARKSTSTWTSSALAVGLALGLAGCGSGTGVMRAAPERVLVADRSVVVSGPPGYCIDRALSRARDANAFVMLGSCAAIANSASKPAPPVPAILTVSVSPPLDVALRIDALRRYLDTQAGRAALSRGGDPASVEILETRGIDDVLFIRARDRDTATMPGVSDTYWRALFALNERLITASAVGFTGEPITSAEGYETLRALVFRLRRENHGVTVSTRSGLPG